MKTENFNKITYMDIARTLQFLGCRPTIADVKLIIWVSEQFQTVRIVTYAIFACVGSR